MPRQKSKQIRTRVTLPEALFRQVRYIAADQGADVLTSDVVKKAVEEYVARQKPTSEHQQSTEDASR